MKLSVVIVNYNVEHFLEQCLLSVQKAMHGIEGEIFVVDNNSVDGSVRMVREKFPEVRLIANTSNPGFSKANNQALRISSGQYVLLLNPDTVVAEDTFSTCIAFMDSHTDAGACGVKLIDGKGKFLPESKRGLPTPGVAFYKISGLSAIFPRSQRFGRYHLGFLEEDKTNKVDVLSGAFMFIRKEALDKAGLLDEAFFMYGEDIDLSYRITQAGYSIYYHPATRIIHYRGESTRKSSINYVFVFYRAMIIFAGKHFSQNNARTFSLLINIAVYLRAGLAVFKRIIKASALPVSDALFLFAGMYVLKNYWAERSGIFYPHEFLRVAVPLYILNWITSMWMCGAYDKPFRLSRAIRGIVIGTLLILVVYALLPEQFRYSRFLTLVGAGWAAVAACSLRLVFNLVTFKSFFPDESELKRILIIGDLKEGNRIVALLNQSPVKTAFLGIVHPDKENAVTEGYSGNIGRLKDMVEIFGINELIFCGKDMSSAEIMDQMVRINHPELEYKIAPPESLFIIGSNSIQTSGDLYVIGLNSMDKPSNKRKKRLFDFTVSGLLLLLFPALLFVKNGGRAVSNVFGVLIGKMTFVSYAEGAGLANLPKIKQGILHPLDPFTHLESDEQTRYQSNILYAKDYMVKNDLNVLLKGWKKLGRNV